MSALPAFARFWMVCRKPSGPQSRSEPRLRYSTIDDARRAAALLARSNDAAFLILETIEVIRPVAPGDTADDATGLFGGDA